MVDSLSMELRRFPDRLVEPLKDPRREFEAVIEEAKVFVETKVLVDAIEGDPLSKSDDGCPCNRGGVCCNCGGVSGGKMASKDPDVEKRRSI